MELFDIGGNEFYFDLDEISDFVRIEEKSGNDLEELLNNSQEKKENNETIESQGPLIDMTRWDLLKDDRNYIK